MPWKVAAIEKKMQLKDKKFGTIYKIITEDEDIPQEDLEKQKKEVQHIFDKCHYKVLKYSFTPEKQGLVNKLAKNHSCKK